MDWILHVIQGLMLDKYTGKLEINFSNGGICSADKVVKEHLKPQSK